MTEGLVTIEEIQDLVEQFVEQNDISRDIGGNQQFKVMVEEVGELAETLVTKQSEEEIKKECADVIFTVMVQAELEDIDISDELRRVSEENLKKTSDRAGYKITDDR